ncbi:hypothetical protein BV898_16396 [Hypsibius exemplaris]|uniref:Gustatory receptor n=1 Tax=Hypsibius exemplaris TaxID=2072580 RepID=A0A9X6RLS6_HYPEX|nr:hypothetical protein BV898_16396 [Hypsibius exemplaris]
MAEDITFVQSFLLAPFLSSCPEGKTSRVKKFLRHVQNTFSIAFLCATAGLVMVEMSATLGRSIASRSITTADPMLITLVKNLWNCSYPIRAILILGIFKWKQSDWRNLHQTAHRCLGELDPSREKSGRRLGRWSVVLFVVTFVALFVPVALIWQHRPSPATNASLHRDSEGHAKGHGCEFTYFGYCIPFAVLLALWTSFADLPFLLSQQVLLAGIIFAMRVVRILKGVDRDVRHEIERLGSLRHCDTVLRVERVKMWTRTFVVCQLFLRQFNAFYEWILLLSVGLDILAALGLGAKILNPAKGPADTTAALYLALVCFAFLAYATVFFIPFVQIGEESGKIDRSLRELIWIVKGHYSKHNEDEEHEVLRDQHSRQAKSAEALSELSAIIQQNPLAVEAGGLFSFSRRYLVTVVSSVATLLLVAQEVLDRTINLSPCQASRNDIANDSAILEAN